MQKRVRKPHPEIRRDREDRDPSDPGTQAVEAIVSATNRIQDDLSDLMHEIDAVLVQNAAQFVAEYIQAGGE